MQKLILAGLLVVLGITVAAASVKQSQGMIPFCYEAEIVGVDPWRAGEVDHLYHPLPLEIIPQIDSMPTYPRMLICTQTPDTSFKFDAGRIG